MTPLADPLADLDLHIVEELDPREPCQHPSHGDTPPPADWCVMCRRCSDIKRMCDPCLQRLRKKFNDHLNSPGGFLANLVLGVPAVCCGKCGAPEFKRFENLVEWWPIR